MTLFDKCPVCRCGGEVVEREVEKVLRGGNRAESVKIRASVCLRCGEHFYGPKVVKRLAAVRAKLKMSDAPDTPWINLQDKLEYEIWFLNFLEKHRDKDDEVSVVMKNGEIEKKEMVSETSLASHYTTPLLKAMMPLTFVACYKTLDMLFEWILEENGKKVPR